MARLDRIGVNLAQWRRKLFSFNVMARLDRATRRGTVPRRVARSSRAMTAGERPAHQNLLQHRLKLTPMRLDRATRCRFGWPARARAMTVKGHRHGSMARAAGITGRIVSNMTFDLARTGRVNQIR